MQTRIYERKGYMAVGTINSIIQYVESWCEDNAYTTRGDGSLPEKSFTKFTENLDEYVFMNHTSC